MTSCFPIMGCNQYGGVTLRQQPCRNVCTAQHPSCVQSSSTAGANARRVRRARAGAVAEHAMQHCFVCAVEMRMILYRLVHTAVIYKRADSTTGRHAVDATVVNHWQPSVAERMDLHDYYAYSVTCSWLMRCKHGHTKQTSYILQIILRPGTTSSQSDVCPQCPPPKEISV